MANEKTLKTLKQKIGKLIIVVYFKDEHEKMIARKKTGDLSTAQAEQRIIGINHAEIGAMGLERFTLPKAICEAVRYHDLENSEISGSSNRRLKLIAREAIRIVDKFALPEEMAPRDKTNLNPLRFSHSPYAYRSVRRNLNKRPLQPRSSNGPGHK